uniref:F-box domain-containing protein n=1 Tax=Aegilops tauschii subsp. strangulata TaxID=200361 RepID=A0A453GCH5_AEGTS
PVAGQKRKRSPAAAGEVCGGRRKRQASGPDYLDGIPDDLVLSIFSKLAASANSPSDLLSVHLTCKRLNGLGQQDMVFAKASPASLAVKAAAWSEPVQRFLKRCADAGNLEACYILGMDPVLLPWQPERWRGSAREGGCRRAPGGALLAGRHPVQRQRGRQDGPRPARRGGALRALRCAGPCRRAPRARALPPGRLRRAPRPRRGTPPPRRRERPRALPRARRRGGQRDLPLRLPPHQRRRRRRRRRQQQPTPLRLRVEPAGGGAPHGEPVHVRLVGVARRAGVRQ